MAAWLRPCAARPAAHPPAAVCSRRLPAIRVRRSLALAGLALGAAGAARTRCRAGARDAVAVLMDGDGQGPREFRAAWKALSSCGRVVYTGVFAARGQLRRPEWRKFCEESGAEGVAVEPEAQELPSTALARAALSWAEHAVVALMPSEREGRPASSWDANLDVDFVALAELLTARGAQVWAVLLEGPAFRCPESVGLAAQFRRRGVEVFWVEVAWFGFRTPRMRAVLDATGAAGCVEPILQERGPLPDITHLIAHLLEHGFMETPRDAIAPAIARFWAQNVASRLTVWPAQYPLHQLNDILGSGSTWKLRSAEMAFVMPLGSKGRSTKEVIARYGTADCRSIYLGGGPFLLEDSRELPSEVLRRLGYLDDDLNSDLDEAVALFCDGTANRRTLQVADCAPLDAGMPTQPNIGELLSLFLQCAIFTILKVHQLYDPGSFSRLWMLEQDVWWSNCAEVEDYVVGLCESLRPAVNRNRLKRVMIDVLGASSLRYVLSFPHDPQQLLANKELMRELKAQLTKLEVSAPAVAASRWRVLVETRRPAPGERRQEALVPRWRGSPLTPGPGDLQPLGVLRGADDVVVASLHVEDMPDVHDALMVSSQDETPRR
ncbi:unnamed protein product [Effrenium voratum]|nr:unnamed protein product [Effrenium voratum]